MANSGVPSGGNYPSRQELSALLKPFLGDVPKTDLQNAKKLNSAVGSSVNIDRRFLYGKQVNRIFQDQVNESDQANGMMNAGAYYAPESYDISQTATDDQLAAAGGNAPAFIEWEVPTSSTDYQRPRTVAAGYDAARETMTVVFRDGTFYNYYEVSATEWEAFHASYSKGKPWLNRKNGNQASDGLFIGKPRGDAGDMSDINPQIREALYRVARSQQIKTKPKAGRTSQTLYRNRRGGDFYDLQDSARGRKRQQLEVPNRLKKDITANRGGVNPALHAGKAPKRKAS